MQDDPSREAGDPACWLGVICPQCGEVREDLRAERCAKCGYDFDAIDASGGIDASHAIDASGGSGTQPSDDQH